MSNVVQMKGMHTAPKSVRSTMDTIVLTQEVASKWVAPPFQRDKRKNKKVAEIAEELKHNGGVVSGVLTLGSLDSENHSKIYLVDGQHRVEAAMQSGVECYADVRICKFESMAHMGEEFCKISSQIVRTTPDDMLRAMEGTVTALSTIRKGCPFVGYGNIRRNPTAPLLSMSSVLRCWRGSAHETPALTGAGKSALANARDMTQLDAEQCVQFLNVARSAWGAEMEYARLWTALNLTLCMWLWRTLVLDRERGVKRYVVLNADQFRKALMSVSASSDYIDWLGGRQMGERDRAPCFARLKSIFTRRLQQEANSKKVNLPQPAWAS